MIGSSILVVTFVVTMVFAQKAPPSCKGSPNNFPIITQPPKLMKTVKNGALYQVPIDKISTPLLIAHVYGTPYEMGFAQGKLLSEEIKYTTKGLYTLVNENIDQFIPHWPKSIQEIVNFLGDEALDMALELEVEATRAYVKSYYTEEINGMADGSGLSRHEVRRLQMFPELLKAHCSMFGAWGSATPNGDLIQLRALDWNTNTPFQQYPLLLVYHPSDPNSNTFATLTWPGLLGAITGLSAAPLGICEKVWLHFKGESTRFGEPFSFVLRDILQFDKTNEEAIHRIKTAHRTCSIFAGVGSKASGEFVAMEYSYPNVTVWSEKTQPVYKNHPLIKDVVYVDKHTQPDTHDPCMADLLSMYHGKLTPEITLKNITAQFQTGDMHIAIYDFAKMNLYIANASPYVNGKAIPAYNRPFVRLSATDLFNRKQ